MRTAEFVSQKHPDKLCDQISDAVLDHCLKLDPYARVAVETMGGHGLVFILGEVTLSPKVKKQNFQEVTEEIVERILGHKGMEVSCKIVPQSADIKKGVDVNGAGDQGIMRGYATRETPEYMPIEYVLARNLCDEIYKEFPYDGKTQITVDDEKKVTAIVASFQYASSITLEDIIEKWVKNSGIKVAKGLKIYANPAGDWDNGSFDADTGLTGRKLMIDNYGPRYAIGGGAFSGKDATKVDRSAAYIARKLAVEILESNPDIYETEVEIAYAIGVAEPVGFKIVGRTEDGEIIAPKVMPAYELNPNTLISNLNLRQPIYEETARRGHFGNGFAWR